MKMLNNKIILGFAFSCVLATGCSDQDYVDANTNPDVLDAVPPQNQFLDATLSLQGQDFEAYYDTYRRIMPWMQYVTPVNGNGDNFTRNIDNFSQRYSRLYIGVGDALTDLEKLVEDLSEEEEPQYVYMVNIAHILRAYYTFYVSDIYGSIPYSEAWQARYGGTQTPVYDDQESLFTNLDADVEEAVSVLSTTQGTTQVSLGNYDQYYRGDVQSWIRAGNALRLKIATRFIKRDQDKAQAIAQEVIAQDENSLMANNAQGWVFKANSGFNSGGNWNPDGLYATQPLVDFMWDYADPRLDAFFSPNGYSQEIIDILIADPDTKDKLEPGTTEASRRYFGSFTSPDESTDSDNDAWYYYRTASVGGSDRRVDTISLIQRRLFQPAFDEGNGAGTGYVYQPVIGYAEFCFMRAEFAARGLTGDDPAEFYEKGVTASIEWYNQLAVDGQLSNYTEVTTEEIEDYLEQPDIAYDESIGLDQIASQAFLNYFKQPAEGWAVWKRTGFPNTTSVLALTDMKTNGVSLEIPRRAPLSLPSEASANYANQKAAYDEMATIEGFGAGPTDAFGRVWWDKP